MNISNNWLFFLCFCILSFIGCNWNAPDECNGNNREIQINTEFKPHQYHFNKGDTLEISFDFPNNIYDTHNEEYVDISEMRFIPSCSISKVEGNELIGANKNFEYISEVGEFHIFVLSNSELAVTCRFVEFENSRYFKGKLVLNKEGQYVLSYYHLPTDLVLEECPSRRVFLDHKMSNNPDNYLTKLESESLQEEFLLQAKKMTGGFNVFEISE